MECKMKKKYSFRFLKQDEWKFRDILSRLDEAEYSIITDIHADPEATDQRAADKLATIEMDELDALTFRMGMEPIRIVPERTAEEEAAKTAREDRHKIKITVNVPMGDGA